ncbi:hypothetical protein BV97_05660 [Novosphingobium resinovorum]|uniref:Uncharacterized protein n=1 Tax=Novosphingobium resinovorum TaxID=158500 RepID=A0A031J2G6_9SPHN|nr:hypothetical protein BV97_05660 [Novosphingobium resinovorum]
MSRRRVKEIINSTGRLHIAERAVSLSLGGDPAVVRVLRLDLPVPAQEDEAFETADVWMEASQARTASFDRWAIGTTKSVRAKGGSSQHLLKNFSDPTDALFTVKVVAADGLILASSDEIRPDDRRSGEREALLQVRSRNLGELTWAVDIAPDGQTSLVVNSRIPAAETWIESDPVASALVLPAALRIVLTKLLSDDSFRESDWGRAWSEWAASVSPVEPPTAEDIEEHEAWIEQTLREFAQNHRLASRVVSAMERHGEMD